MFQTFVVNHAPSLEVAQGPREDHLEHELCGRGFWRGLALAGVRHLDLARNGVNWRSCKSWTGRPEYFVVQIGYRADRYSSRWNVDYITPLFFRSELSLGI